jgi:hypothetical protein
VPSMHPLRRLPYRHGSLLAQMRTSWNDPTRQVFERVVVGEES